jgi:hypothetical protein
MVIKSKIKLFPAVGRFVPNSYVKYNNNMFKVISIYDDSLVLETGLTVKKHECTLHKLYVSSKKILAELSYEDCDKINIHEVYKFRIDTLLTRPKVGDIVNVFKFKLCNILSNTSIHGIITEILPNGECNIELANGELFTAKRHMFSRQQNYKYLARWIS